MSAPPVSGDVDARPSRVLVVLHEAPLAGATLAVLRVIPLLEERGWRFSFWVPLPGAAADELASRGHEFSGAERPIGYSLRSLRTGRGVLPRLAATPGYLRRFRGWVAEQGADLVHVNTVNAVPELLAARGATRASVLHVHELVPPNLKGAAAARLMRVAADEVVTVSAASARALARHGVRATCVGNGVFVPPEAPKRAARERLVIGMLGTVSQGKGSDLFLAAVERLRGLLPAAEYRMIGRVAEGQERWGETMLATASRLGVTTGTTSDPYDELAGWDIVVTPSRQDAMPLVVAEAMASSLPVVATRVGGIPEMVDSGCAILVDPDDVDALVAAVLELARDPRRRAAMGAAGRARAVSRLTLERQADELHRSYVGLLGRRSPKR